jgi:FMN phosphatase YigB (HAD superfamily)
VPTKKFGPRPKAIVSDIDGTITAEPHSDGHNKPVPQMIRLLWNYRRKGYAIVLLTARDEHKRQMTLYWLRRHRVPFDVLLMKPNDDQEPPWLYKLHAFRAYIEPYYDVHAALDDKVNCWRLLGIRRPNLHRIRSLGGNAYQYMS